MKLKAAGAFLLLIGAIFLFNNCSKSDSNAAADPVANTPASKIGINTLGGWSDSPFISRDGKRLYFMYSRYNFAPWIMSGGTTMPQVEGPDRLGLHKSSTNPWDESDYYVATKNTDGTWSEPIALGLNGNFGDSSGMEINNGNTFVWLQGDGVTNNLVIANKNPDGSWGGAVDLGSGINDHSTGVFQDNPHITPDGKGLFFVSNRSGGQGERDIWFSVEVAGTWSAPVALSATFNSPGDEDQMWINPTTNDIYWNSPQGIKHCVSNGATCAAAPTLVVIPGCDFAAEVSMPDDGSIMYFGCGNTTTGRVLIMYSVQQPDGSWGTATAVD